MSKWRDDGKLPKIRFYHKEECKFKREIELFYRKTDHFLKMIIMEKLIISWSPDFMECGM